MMFSGALFCIPQAFPTFTRTKSHNKRISRLTRMEQGSDHDFVEIISFSGCEKILLDIKYATADNFTNKVQYDSARCFARRGVAKKLARVQKTLEGKGLGLLIWDAYRPHHVQWKLWEIVPDEKFVADPRKGSNHNRGAAVDLTLVDSQGIWQEMPTGFDDFTEKAYRSFNDAEEHTLRNRKLLQDVMEENGFIGLPTENWHFDDIDSKKYEVSDLSFAELVEKLKQ
mmetsp:Transcript_34073/g.55183  ORF Transcript_34073/g.55183 Transcript_34073/m.55183 type:complete len:227 (-) Transcript_34073:12-692(-)